MTPSAADATTIPARVTARQLAEAIGREVAEVVAALTARGEPNSSEDYLDHAVARAVARSLGAEVTIETRDLVLEALYETETRGEHTTELTDRAGRMAFGVLGARESLDKEIESASEHWSVARMPVIDRNILRIGLYELENEPGTPVAVIMSEAVRLAQTYSTERSASFVNGVLATLAKRVREG